MHRPGIWVALLNGDVSMCDDIGATWHQNRKRAGSKHVNNRPLDDAYDLPNKQAAVASEFAAKCALGCTHWTAYGDIVGKGKQPDLDGFIDVKKRIPHLNPLRERELLVQFTDPKQRAYLSVLRWEPRVFLVDSWCWGIEIAFPRLKKEWQKGRPCYSAHPDELFMKTALELRELVAAHPYGKGDPPKPPQRVIDEANKYQAIISRFDR